MVVRSGYGINYNTGAYSGFASSMSFQQPFAITQNNTLTAPTSPTTCTKANMSWNTKYQNTTGYNCSTQTTQSNFGVNPNYRLGMVQVYNLGIQRTLPQGIVLNIDYTGAYGINQDVLRKPNRNAYGILNSSSGQFSYEDALGFQRSNALAVNLRERMHKGVSLQGTYTFSHSIDDASTVGGGSLVAPPHRTTWTSAPRRATPASTVVIPSAVTSSSNRPSAPTEPSSTRAVSSPRSSTATPSPATSPLPRAPTLLRRSAVQQRKIKWEQIICARTGTLHNQSRVRLRASPGSTQQPLLGLARLPICHSRRSVKLQEPTAPPRVTLFSCPEPSPSAAPYRAPSPSVARAALKRASMQTMRSTLCVIQVLARR